MTEKDPLEEALNAIQKKYGPGSVWHMGDKAEPMESISTQCISLDLALGIGGLPKGRIVEIYGPESSGKSTLATHIVAQAQSEGLTCAYIDAEHAMDPIYAGNIGVDVDSLIISQPDDAEQALEITETLIRTGKIGVIVVDSVAALVPRAEIAGEMGDSHIGLQARLMGQAMRKLAGSVHKTDTILIFINQLRYKVGVMFGSPEVTSGGNALKFYASVRLDIRRIESLKDGDGDVVANRTRVKVVKNKVAPPFKMCEFDIVFGEGISKAGSLIDVGVDFDIVKKSGAWYSYGELQLGQGREKSKEFLKDNPQVADELYGKITEVISQEF